VGRSNSRIRTFHRTVYTTNSGFEYRFQAICDIIGLAHNERAAVTKFDALRGIMSSEYPDVLGDLVDAHQRYEVNGVHYMAALQPSTIAPGETTNLHIWLQNCWDMPVQVAITIHLPAQPSPPFTVIQNRTDVPLKPAEVGQVIIPIASATRLGPGDHTIAVTISAQFETRGLYVRSQKNKGYLGETLLNFTTGMALSSTIGLGFVARTQPEQELHLHVEGAARPGAPPDLTPTYISHWIVDDLLIQGKARKLVNDQRLYLQPQLTRQAIFGTFLEESRERFKEAGLSLHIGESIFLSKVLTYTVEYFLQHPDRQDVILIPAYSLAYRYNLPTSDPVFLIVRADYARIARLAISLSFGLLRQHLKHDIWTIDEQLAVTDLVADRVEHGGALPAEFLYLPLLLGGLMVSSQVQMPGENLAQSLNLLQTARQQRSADLSENPELVALLDRLFQLARAGH
jgi:hypothetical protein